MAGWQRRTTILQRAFAGMLFVWLCFIAVGHVSAQTTDVTVDIPEGKIIVEGKTSPSAQVKMYENGNDVPAASVVADSSGFYSSELPQYSPGLVDVSVQATDTNGRKSALITRQVAVIAHQSSTLTIILPPTISVNPESAVYQTGTLNFSGQTMPGASVKVKIEPSITLTTVADSQGIFNVPLLVRALASAGIYEFGVESSYQSEASDYAIMGTFVISPPIETPFTPPNPPLIRIIDRFVNQTVPTPEITYPSESEYTSPEPFVMTGRAEAGTILSVYDGDLEIGAITVDEYGDWKYYFSPFKESHRLSVKSCRGDKCSESSRTILVKPHRISACQTGITLHTYRLKAETGKPVSFPAHYPKEPPASLTLHGVMETTSVTILNQARSFTTLTHITKAVHTAVILS